MTIKSINGGNKNIFGIEISDKFTASDVERFLPEMDSAVSGSDNRIRLLIDVSAMQGADIKSEWEIFEFLKKHMKAIEYIAIVGAHSWTKIMSEILSESIFIVAETRYFKKEESDDAWKWLNTSVHPSHVPVRKVIYSDKGLFTKYSSPDYI